MNQTVILAIVVALAAPSLAQTIDAQCLADTACSDCSSSCTGATESCYMNGDGGFSVTDDCVARCLLGDDVVRISKKIIIFFFSYSPNILLFVI